MQGCLYKRGRQASLTRIDEEKTSAQQETNLTRLQAVLLRIIVLGYAPTVVELTTEYNG